MRLFTYHRVMVVVATFALIIASSQPYAESTPPTVTLTHVDEIYPVDDVLEPFEPSGAELTMQGRNVRGIYVPVKTINNWSVKKLTRWVVGQVGANAVIIDIKDDRGRVTFTRELEYATGSQHGAARNKMVDLVESLQAQGVYVIGRLVCFKDNQFVFQRPSVAIRDKRNSKIWRDHSKMAWIDPFSKESSEYIASIAIAAQETGFDEIQLDYVRFPVSKDTVWARFPNRKKNATKPSAIVALLAQVDRAIELPISIDVFGLTAYHPSSSHSLGQSLEDLAPYIDVISPMLYLANWPEHVWANPKPSRTHALVHNAVVKIRQRLGDDIAVRPLLQAFSYRAQNFGPGFMLNQIDAAQSAGSSGYLFWNQSGKYREVSLAWGRLERSNKRNLGKVHVLNPAH